MVPTRSLLRSLPSLFRDCAQSPQRSAVSCSRFAARSVGLPRLQPTDRCVSQRPGYNSVRFSVKFAVEKSTEILERVAATEPIARKLDAIQRAEWPVRFSHVIQTGQPFLTAVIAHAYHAPRLHKRQAVDSTIWVLCPSVHSQEVFYESLLNWQPDALFLPEAELTGIENVLPDPEITAERLALFLQIERDTSPRIIVATRACLDQAAPKFGSLESAVVQLRRGVTTKMEIGRAHV